MEVETKRKAAFELHADTRILINIIHHRLMDESVETVTYAELNRAIGGRNVQKEANGLLQTARKHVEQNDKIKIETVRDVGLKITDDYGGCLRYARERIRRISRKETKTILNAIDGRDLPGDQKRTIMAELSLMSALQLFTGPQMPTKILDKIEANEQNQLPTAETLRLFLPNGKTTETAHK